MKCSKCRKRIFVLVFLITLLVVISMVIPYKQALVFLQVDKGDVLCYLPLATGDTFKIKYKHSIHLSDVIESYEVTKQSEIRQYELEYEDFAIGMPSDIVEGEVFVMENGKYFIKNMKRDFPYFDLRVGQVVANHTVIYQNETYPLSRAIKPGSPVRVQIIKMNFLQQLKGVNIFDDE